MALEAKNIGSSILTGLKNKALKTIVSPVSGMIDENISDISTTIGSFIIRSIRGKFQRSITFTIGVSYADYWMEEALYGVLYEYNKIKRSSKLELSNKRGMSDGSGLYYKLDDGTHNLKYRKWDILLFIQTKNPQSASGRVQEIREYTIITYDLDPEFVTLFESDMLRHRNALLKIKANSPTINVFNDLHESDGYTYWEKTLSITKRKLGTIYIPDEQKRELVTTINNFFASKKFYQEHGIPWNLKILLYGPAGPQPLDVDIPTPAGMVKMGDLKPGDHVFGMNGIPTRIEEIYEYEDLDVYEVSFDDGRKVLCGEDHKWPTITSRGGFKERSVKEMLREGITETRPDGSKTEHKFRIGVGLETRMPYKPIPIDPWVLGVFIGNGNLREHVLTLSAPNAIIPRIIAAKYDFDLKHRDADPHDYNWKFYHKDGSPVRTKEFFKDLPQFINSYSYEKSIPDDYIFNTSDVRFGIIQGLMDTDGYISENEMQDGRDFKRVEVKYNSTSRKLIEQVRLIVHSLGFSAYVYEDSRHEMYTSGYCADVCIRCIDADKALFFRYSHKIERAYRARYRHQQKKSEKNSALVITDIKKLDTKCKMRCLHVEDPMHIYLTTNFVPTCNSGKSSIVKMIASEWNRNLYECTGGKGGKFIPNAITDNSDDVNYPLFSISDIDKYPFLINEPDVDMDKENAKEEKMGYKQIFASMINALDGIMSAEGRIIVMTTNHIEKFSPIILRKGRIDLQMEIGYVTVDVFRKYVKDFFNIELPPNIKLKRDNLTIADMQADIIFMKMGPDEFIAKYTTK